MERVIDVRNGRNLTMLSDFYELTMGNGYFENGVDETIAYFDMYFRKIPDEGGFAVMAGVDQLIEYLENLTFTKEDIDFLRSKNTFSEGFLSYLENFKFECDVWAVPEGTPVFPNEPLVTVRGPIIQAQFVETMVLLTVNHQTLIATKANRIVRAAAGRDVLEFGSRRAQGYDGAIYGTRAAIVGGATSSSNTLAEIMFNVPAVGTMAHSWVQLFDSEYEAFRKWAEIYPDKCSLLVDTYNVLKSGIPNAIKVFNEYVLPTGNRPKSIRIDSGDITYLTKQSRRMLDEAGFEDVKIIVSNSLDEYIIRDVLAQGAPIDVFGVGERLITARSEPVFGGVYKLVAVERDGKITPKIKVSENQEKITTPHFKKIYRVFSNKSGLAVADLLCEHDEVIDESQPLTIFDPTYTWKRRTFKEYTLRELQERIFEKGALVYKSPTVLEIRAYSKKEIENLWPEALRLEYPHRYYVDLSQKLWDTRQNLLIEQSQMYAEDKY
ncbi:MAG: nicotinate phosphoribosyltransferase [Clostridia bacterium]|nr:nicotinate phosphoribosyltransferase [Clostridia bacterium]